MCTHGACSNDCDYSLPSNGLGSAPIPHANAESGDSTNYHYTYSAHHPPFILHSVGLPGPSAADQAFEGAENPVNIQQPPPGVADYWSGWAKHSLDPPPSENAPNPANFLSRFPPIDGISDVSSSLAALCCTLFFCSLRALSGFPNSFPPVRFWNDDSRKQFPCGPSSL